MGKHTGRLNQTFSTRCKGLQSFAVEHPDGSALNRDDPLLGHLRQDSRKRLRDCPKKACQLRLCYVEFVGLIASAPFAQIDQVCRKSSWNFLQREVLDQVSEPAQALREYAQQVKSYGR